MMNDTLVKLYNRTSKHSNYQILPTPLQKLIPVKELQTKTRYEQERFRYISEHILLLDCSVADIGGNTGYFSFEALECGACEVYYYEGNQAHAAFVIRASADLGWNDKLHVVNRYLEFGKDAESLKVDVIFLLNVLHHFGDDYGDPCTSIEIALGAVEKALRLMASCSKYLVLQIGFNWKGNRSLPLFKHGTKREMIDFVREKSKGAWAIKHIGVPWKYGSDIRYEDLTDANIERRNDYGEFLNRPIFILESTSFARQEEVVL